MDKYRVEILNRAYKNIDDIYEYIANELLAPDAAIHLIEKFEDALLSLETMPSRFSTRKQEDMPINVTGRFL